VTFVKEGETARKSGLPEISIYSGRIRKLMARV